MAELIPSTGAYIINTSMTSFTTGTISTDLVNPEWSYTLTPIDNAPDDVLGKNFNIDHHNVLTVEYFSYDHLFPIKEISYVGNSYDYHTISTISDLPEPLKSPFIYRYIIDGKNYLEWKLDVTVSGMDIVDTDDGTGTGGGVSAIPTTLSGSYIIYINVNYDINRDILLGLLEERSKF